MEAIKIYCLLALMAGIAAASHLGDRKKTRKPVDRRRRKPAAYPLGNWH